MFFLKKISLGHILTHTHSFLMCCWQTRFRHQVKSKILAAKNKQYAKEKKKFANRSFFLVPFPVIVRQRLCWITSFGPALRVGRIARHRHTQLRRVRIERRHRRNGTVLHSRRKCQLIQTVIARHAVKGFGQISCSLQNDFLFSK